MAQVVKTIGTGQDYTTIAAWEADLDNTTPYNAGDDAVGQCLDQVFDEVVDLSGGATLGLNSVKLTATSLNRHDGTAGTGARVVPSAPANHGLIIQTPLGFHEQYAAEWLEIDMGDAQFRIVHGNNQNSGNVGSVSHCLLHDCGEHTGVDSFERDLLMLRNIVYNVSRASSVVRGVRLDSDNAAGGFLNNTVFGISNPQAGGEAKAFATETDSSNSRVRNNIVVGTSADLPLDFEFAGISGTSTNNLSSDASADDGGGTGHVLNAVTADQFVSTVAGSEDLHLKTGSDAIGAGADLGITPTGVNIDIDGFDVDAAGAIWDIGAHQFELQGPNTGSGTPQAQPSTVEGTGEVSNLGSGAAAMQAATVEGTGTTFRTVTVSLTGANQLRDINQNTIPSLAGIRWEWYDTPGATEGEPIDKGTVATDASGNATITVVGSVLENGEFGQLLLYHPTENKIRGSWRLPVSTS